jgi:hypothetical protein
LMGGLIVIAAIVAAAYLVVGRHWF